MLLRHLLWALVVDRHKREAINLEIGLRVSMFGNANMGSRTGVFLTHKSVGDEDIASSPDGAKRNPGLHLRCG